MAFYTILIFTTFPCDEIQHHHGFFLFIPYGSFDETRHDSYAHATAGHDEYLHKLAFAFEILRHHQSGTISGHANADP